ncbi:MAG TPA: DUF2203 domain-containing protein [Acidimicrobiales bacterium]|nr:DUF2203 domain-containing protein [Acidimicrobiales bacterium]
MRYWTVEEAQAYIPRLRLLLGVIRRAKNLVVSARGNGHAVLPGAPSPAGPPKPPSSPAGSHPSGWTASESPPGEPEVPDTPPMSEAPVSFDAKEALAELEEEGIILRDPERGLIDFTALHNGREVLLCWQLGEDELAWWHFPDDGFAGRRPLPLPPEF